VFTSDTVRLVLDARDTVVERVELPDLLTAEALIADNAQAECRP
jgi:hypothetical protein